MLILVLILCYIIIDIANNTELHTVLMVFLSLVTGIIYILLVQTYVLITEPDEKSRNDKRLSYIPVRLQRNIKSARKTIN